jgi:hypothetical protein
MIVDDNDAYWHDYFKDEYVTSDEPPEGVTRRTHYLQKITCTASDHTGKVINESSAYHWVVRPRRFAKFTL